MTKDELALTIACIKATVPSMSEPQLQMASSLLLKMIAEKNSSEVIKPKHVKSA